MYKISTMIISILLVGCSTTANYEKKLTSWVGSSVDDLVLAWGPPERTYERKDGGKILEYSKSRNVRIGGYSYSAPQTTYSSGTASAYGSRGNSSYGNYSGTSTTYVQKTTPATNIALGCKTRFAVNSSGIITKFRFAGNDCKALKSDK